MGSRLTAGHSIGSPVDCWRTSSSEGSRRARQADAGLAVFRGRGATRWRTTSGRGCVDAGTRDGVDSRAQAAYLQQDAVHRATIALCAADNAAPLAVGALLQWQTRTRPPSLRARADEQPRSAAHDAADDANAVPCWWLSHRHNLQLLHHIQPVPTTRDAGLMADLHARRPSPRCWMLRSAKSNPTTLAGRATARTTAQRGDAWRRATGDCRCARRTLLQTPTAVPHGSASTDQDKARGKGRGILSGAHLGDRRFMPHLAGARISVLAIAPKSCAVLPQCRSPPTASCLHERRGCHCGLRTWGSQLKRAGRVWKPSVFELGRQTAGRARALCFDSSTAVHAAVRPWTLGAPAMIYV